jgi:hypothetical protein
VLWLLAGWLAVRRVDPPSASRRALAAAVSVGVAYFLVVATLSGVLAPGSGSLPGEWRVLALPFGWGPAVVYDGPVRARLVPFRLLGYVALSYLVGVAALSVSRRAGGLVALGGVVGLATCVSCAFPLLAAVAGTVLGAGTATTAGSLTVEVSTAAYLLSLAALSRV